MTWTAPPPYAKAPNDLEEDLHENRDFGFTTQWEGERASIPRAAEGEKLSGEFRLQRGKVTGCCWVLQHVFE